MRIAARTPEPCGVVTKYLISGSDFRLLLHVRETCFSLVLLGSFLQVEGTAV